MTIRSALADLVLAALTLTACGGAETPSGPTNPPIVVGPTVLGISPASGPTAGGTPVTVSGANFTNGATIAIGGVPAANVKFVNSTSLQATTGARTAGPADVTVTVDGRSSTLASAFTYVALPPPTISSVVPSTGSTSGGTTIAVTGTNFASGATVTVGGVAATGVTALSSTTLRAVTGPRAAGAADVVVAVGAQSATLARGFTYVMPGPNLQPAITSLVVRSTRASAPSNVGGACACANEPGVDGCAGTPATWRAVDERTNRSETITGTARTTAVSGQSRWWRCDSDFEGTTTRPVSTFSR